MKKSVIIALLLAISVNGFAQLKVKSNNKVVIGTEIPFDGNHLLSAIIFGTHGEYKSGGKLAFGDFGQPQYSGVNVFVGEYDTTDTDQLWLHGKKGLYLTYGGSASNVFGYYDIAVGNRFTFNCDVYSQGVKLTSDERFKKNINKLESSLTLLTQLDGVSYNYDADALDCVSKPQPLTSSSLADADKTTVSQTESTEKEKRDMAFFENYEQQLKQQQESKKRLGFIAQEMQEVFPELVDQDSAGFYYVDYIGLIPVIVESIKEQQAIILAQAKKIKALESLQNGSLLLRSGVADDSATDMELITSENEAKAILYQNAPNPFKEQTEIRYFLPQTIQQAYICIFDMQGKMLKKLDASAGDNILTIQGSELQAGMYLYSLIADGKEMDTKKMILTK
jgi:hypothetical protein